MTEDPVISELFAVRTNLLLYLQYFCRNNLELRSDLFTAVLASTYAYSTEN